MEDTILWEAAGSQIRIYYLMVLLTFVYFLYKYRKQGFAILVILLFFNGLFAFFGKNLQNIYRIGLVMLTIYWLLRIDPFKISSFKTIIISFIIFTITFLYTSFLNDDYFFIIFSQYSRYFIVFSLFFILNKYRYNDPFKRWLEKLVFELIFIQVIFSAAKYLIIGPMESIVGSVASQGGALATVFPILGFMFIWLKKRGKFETRDWLFTFGLAFIGFVSMKRAIWFIMPILMVLVMFYIPKQTIPLKVAILSLFFVPLVFYLGVRSNPTLNKEGIVGGSFDLNYVFKYAQNYMFGSKDNKQTGQGRGGATLLVYDKFVTGNVTEKDWLGYGLRFMYATNYEEFDEMDFGISGKGAATGFFQTMITNGYIGILALIIFAFSLIFKTKNKRLRYVLFGVFCWEYFFYTGLIFREISLSFLLIYIILFSDFKLKFTDRSARNTEIIL